AIELDRHRRYPDESDVASAAVYDVAPFEMGASPNGHGVPDEGSTTRTLERDPVEQAVVGYCRRGQAGPGRRPRHVEHKAMSAPPRDAVGDYVDQPRRRITKRREDRPYIAQASDSPE